MLSQAMHKADSKQLNVTRTTNGAKAFISTLNANLDFYANSGNMNFPRLIPQFESAFVEDADMALRNALKMRDVRGGHGIRDNFRKVLRHLAQNHFDYVTKTDLLAKVVEVGRWDDIFALLDLNMPTVQNLIVKLVAKELNKGAENSLVAKWLPINSRKSVDQKFLSQLRAYMKLTPKELRQKVVAQRKELVEVKMSAKRFDEIVYSHVPSKAMSLYRNAFRKRDPEGMAKFLEKAVKGEVKVNASTLYPHEVTKLVRSRDDNDRALAEAQWKNLPDFIKGDSKVLPIVDVSGSMNSTAYSTFTCMDISVALGTYIAGRNNSIFKDLVLTFSERPTFVSLTDRTTLYSKLEKIYRAPWGYSTDLEAAFEAVLDLAVKEKAKQEDLPEFLLVLTDMQYDRQTSGVDEGIMRTLKQKFKAAGFKLPKVIWWNIQDGSNTTTPVKFDKEGTAIVSGASPALLEAVLAGDLESYTPYNVMVRDLGQDRYTVTFVGGKDGESTS